MSFIHIYSKGMCHCSVCVPEKMERGIIESQVNQISPTGIDSQWKISEENFKGGEPNPHSCELSTGQLHYLMVC